MLHEAGLVVTGRSPGTCLQSGPAGYEVPTGAIRSSAMD